MPKYDAAAAIPMKWGAAYMAVFMGFWGLAFIENPFHWRHVADKNYQVKWQGKLE